MKIPLLNFEFKLRSRRPGDLAPARWRELPIKYRKPLIITGIILSIPVFLVAWLYLLYEQSSTPAPFPVSVDPDRSVISEDPTVQLYHRLHIAEPDEESIRADWLQWLSDRIFGGEWYEILAAPRARTVVIYPGERKEEVADNFGGILRWDREEKQLFMTLVSTTTPALEDGMFFPDRYLTDKDSGPEAMAAEVNKRFNKEVRSRYQRRVEDKVSLEEALIIASLLEREAYDFTDMREISGVIWNRLFQEMPLQLDATLQYAKGSLPHGPWWPVPLPRDKFIDSPYNTYQNEGLPPGPISNPSLEAILAALNPIETECLFYFHSKGDFYCSETYQEHVANLRAIYGRGR